MGIQNSYKLGCSNHVTGIGCHVWSRDNGVKCLFFDAPQAATMFSVGNCKLQGPNVDVQQFMERCRDAERDA